MVPVPRTAAAHPDGRDGGPLLGAPVGDAGDDPRSAAAVHHTGAMDGDRRDPDPDRAPGPPPPGRPPPNRVESAFDWCFRDRSTGAIVIAQFPNIALATFLVTVVVRWFLPEGSTATTVVSWVAAGALGWWALDEVIRGVNPWRRLLGIGGLLATGAAVAALLAAS
jgi:hypothetical protein